MKSTCPSLSSAWYFEALTFDTYPITLPCFGTGTSVSEGPPCSCSEREALLGTGSDDGLELGVTLAEDGSQLALVTGSDDELL